MTRKRKKQAGGYLTGPSHEQGGIPANVGGNEMIELEGGEYIINAQTVNAVGTQFLDKLNSTQTSYHQGGFNRGQLPGSKYRRGGKVRRKLQTGGNTRQCVRHQMPDGTIMEGPTHGTGQTCIEWSNGRNDMRRGGKPRRRMQRGGVARGRNNRRRFQSGGHTHQAGHQHTIPISYHYHGISTPYLQQQLNSGNPAYTLSAGSSTPYSGQAGNMTTQMVGTGSMEVWQEGLNVGPGRHRHNGAQPLPTMGSAGGRGNVKRRGGRVRNRMQRGGRPTRRMQYGGPTSARGGSGGNCFNGSIDGRGNNVC